MKPTVRHSIVVWAVLQCCNVWLASAAETITVQPARDDAMLVNPGKGWVQYYSPDKYTKDYVAIGYNRWPWSCIEPAEGQFNWKPIDEFVQAFKAYGKKVAFGVINFDGGMGRQYSTPKWVFDAGAVAVEAPDPSMPTGTIVLPKTWNDPVYLAKTKQFIAALGRRYEGNLDIAFIDIRDYGNSGECNGDYHQLTNTSLASLRDDYLAPYIRAFRKTRLIVPWNGAWFQGKPADPVYAWAVSQGVGLRRDGILSTWSKDGSECLMAFGHQPVIFEHEGGHQEVKKSGQWKREWLLQYLLCGKPNYWQWDRALFEDERELCRMVGNKMGYHFVLQRATVPRGIRASEPIRLQLEWLNDGVSYLYEPCQVAVALLDAKNHVVGQQWLAGCNPREWAPGQTVAEHYDVTFASIPTGNHKLAIGLFVNSNDAVPVYRLGIQGRIPDGWYVLSDRTVTH